MVLISFGQVWAGEDQCQEIVWEVFESVEYTAELETLESVCTDDQELPYSQCQEIEYDMEQMCLECKVSVLLLRLLHLIIIPLFRQLPCPSVRW